LACELGGRLAFISVEQSIDARERSLEASALVDLDSILEKRYVSAETLSDPLQRRV
jgi:hypothetical protein